MSTEDLDTDQAAEKNPAKRTNRGDFFKFDPRIISDLTAESPSAGAKAVFKGVCKIGAFSYVGLDSAVTNTSIGRYCSIAPNVTIGPTEHPIQNLSTHPFASGNKGPFGESRDYWDICSTQERRARASRTTIGNDVWIGQNVVIREGVTVGDGAVIAAQAFVGKDVAPYSIVGGVPAKFIRWRFPEEIIARLQALAWWNYNLHPTKSKVDFSDVGAALDILEKMVADGELKPFRPKTRRFK